MRAILRHRYGGPEVLTLEQTDVPTPQDDQVLVRVHAASVNAFDWHMLRGKPYVARLGEGFRRPKAPEMGVDAAGVVEAVGSAVTDLRVGDEVYGGRNGAFSEYVAGRNFVRKPANLSFEEAAAVPMAALTALQGLRDKAAPPARPARPRHRRRRRGRDVRGPDRQGARRGVGHGHDEPRQARPSARRRRGSGHRPSMPRT